MTFSVGDILHHGFQGLIVVTEVFSIENQSHRLEGLHGKRLFRYEIVMSNYSGSFIFHEKRLPKLRPATDDDILKEVERAIAQHDLGDVIVSVENDRLYIYDKEIDNLLTLYPNQLKELKRIMETLNL